MIVTWADWNQDPEVRRMWRETWALPHMQAGLQVLIHSGLPTPSIIVPGEDPLPGHALKAAAYAGYYDFARNIELLKQDPTPPPEGKVGGWGAAELVDPQQQQLEETP